MENEIMDALGNMSVLELIALTKKLETQWGVKAEPMVKTVSVSFQVETTVEQTEFNVVLMSVPADKKISVIKVVREINGMGLKESKELVESAPKAIKESCSKAEAEDIKNKLTNAGGVVEIN